MKKIDETNFSNVNSGSHLGSKEVQDMKVGKILVIEDDIGQDLAKCVYMGEYINPGYFSMLKCTVKLTEVYHENTLRDLVYDDLYNDDRIKMPFPKVGDVVSISR